MCLSCVHAWRGHWLQEPCLWGVYPCADTIAHICLIYTYHSFLTTICFILPHLHLPPCLHCKTLLQGCDRHCSVRCTQQRRYLALRVRLRAATHAWRVQIFSGQMQWPDIAARTLNPPVAQHNSEWQVLEVLMHWPWDRLVLSRTGMGVVQARALGISLAMAVARGAAPLELTCNGTLRTEHLASGSLATAGVRRYVCRSRRRPPGPASVPDRRCRAPNFRQTVSALEASSPFQTVWCKEQRNHITRTANFAVNAFVTMIPEHRPPGDAMSYSVCHTQWMWKRWLCFREAPAGSGGGNSARRLPLCAVARRPRRGAGARRPAAAELDEQPGRRHRHRGPR